MLKTLQIPVRGFLAVVFLLTAAPVSQAAHVVDKDLAESLVKKCRKNSDDNDADDIYKIILSALKDHPDQGLGLIDDVIDELKEDRKKLDNDVSKKDLDRVFKRLKKWLRKHRTGAHGGVSNPETPITRN